MDQEALVDHILEDGARLDMEINRRGFNLDAPIAAFDMNAGQWVLLFGFPTRVSRLQVYETAQSAIAQLELRLNLDQIVLVKDIDPGLRELRDAATAHRTSSWEGQFPSMEVAGKDYVSPRITNLSAFQFEELVRTALERSLPDSFELRRGDEALASSQREFADASYSHHRDIGVDFAAVAGDRVVFVEVKTSRRPVHTERVLSALGQLSYFRYEAIDPSLLALVLVSRSGFTESARRKFENFSGLVLVAWAPGQDEHILADAVMGAVPA